MNALYIERAIRQRADWYRCPLIPEALIRIQGNLVTPQWGEPYHQMHEYFADYVQVTDAGYVTEFEVKTSRGDWLHDMKKQKWAHGPLPSYIARFIYVVPSKLIEKGIPDWVPEFAGVWSVRLVTGYRGNNPEPYIDIVRNPRRIGKEKVPDDVLARWMSVFYYRYWQMRMNLEGEKIQQMSRRVPHAVTKDEEAA